MKKTVLITGANKGIGLEIARQLGLRGWHIFLGARDAGRGRRAETRLREMGISVDFVTLDVGNLSSIKDAFQAVCRHTGQLTALINNAGILPREDRRLLDASPELIDSILQTNAIGALQVTQSFLPLLSTGSRVIFLSSGGGSMTDPVGGWAPVYCISKTLMNGMVRHLAHELRPNGIAVNAVCPGWVKTDLGGLGAPRSVEKGATTVVWLADEAPSDQTGLFWRDKNVIPW